ncbi:DUF1449 family protein [bacterium]|nr:DUF1449 family protein [bacterium]
MRAFLEFAQLWHNTVYLVPLVLGLALFAIQVVGAGLSSSGEHDVDAEHDLDVAHDFDGDVAVGHDCEIGHDVDLDHDLDVDHDVSVDHDADVSHDVAGDHDLDADHDVEVGSTGDLVAGAFRFLNFGRVPFMAVLQSVLLSFGIFGLAATWALAETGRVAAGAPMVLASLPIALVLGLGFSKLLTSILGRFAATVETEGTKLRRLTGEKVTVESLVVDENEGRGTWKDQNGGLHTIYLRTAPGAPPIAKGTRARLERFLPRENVFVCSPAGAGAIPGATSGERKDAAAEERKA